LAATIPAARTSLWPMDRSDSLTTMSMPTPGARQELRTMVSRSATFEFDGHVRLVRLCHFVAAATAVGISRCGEPSAKIETTVPARGALTQRGNPLAHHQIMFHPEDGRRPAAGISNEQGSFVLGTNSADDGAVTGKHRVTVVYVGPPSAARDGMI